MESLKAAGKGLLLFVAAFSVPFLAENAGEFSEWLPGRTHDFITRIATNYQSWAMGPRGNAARYTVLVGLDQEGFPGAVNEACPQRKIITEILPRLVDARASLMVVDLAFLRESCKAREGPELTSQLQETLKSVSAQVPVVVGQASLDLREVPDEEQRTLERQGMRANGLVLRPLIDLPETPDLRVGLMRGDRDLRRVPLEWPAYEISNAMVRFVGMRPSLALQAAAVVRSTFPGGLRAINNFVSTGIHPYTTLIGASGFAQVRAADLLCGSDIATKHCQPETADAVKRTLRGKIAIIGWLDNPRDLQATPVGRLAGVILHANYIEALLDGRLLRAIAFKWQLVLTLAWFLLMEWPFHVWKSSLAKALLGAMIMWVIVAIATYYVLVVNAGWYLALLPPSLIAIVLRCFFSWMEEKKRLSTANGSPPGSDDAVESSSIRLDTGGMA